MRRTAVIVVAAVVVFAIGIALYSAGPSIPDPGVLVVELTGDLEEAPPTDNLSRMFARGPALATVVLQLEKASADDRIVGVVLHLRRLLIGYARLQELRDAVIRVRISGKPVVALLDLSTFNATREVYLASAADQVYVVPGYLGPLAGVAAEFFHLGGMFAKAGVEVEYESVGIYKSAPEALAERRMSEPARRMMTELLDGLFDQILAGIAEGRNLDVDAVRALVDEAPATSAEYLAAGLADGVAGRADLLERAGFEEGVEEVELDDYLAVDPRDLGLRDGPAIALVFGDGNVVQARQRGVRAGHFSADTLASALMEAAERDDVRAIVFRINSPGGSPLASEQLWQTLREVRKRKPIVVSMGDAAASGGYYVASAADAIVAEPATQTGSIGIFFMRIALGGLYRKLDINSEVMTRGRYAGILASSKGLTAGERALTHAFLEAQYREFLDRVSRGRGLSTEEVDAVGQGRVWLGSAARKNGLVDELGGIHVAIARAKAEAGIPPEVDPRRIVLPGPRSFSAQLGDLLSSGARGELIDALLGRDRAEIFRAGSDLLDGDVAYLPSWWIRIH